MLTLSWDASSVHSATNADTYSAIVSSLLGGASADNYTTNLVDLSEDWVIAKKTLILSWANDITGTPAGGDYKYYYTGSLVGAIASVSGLVSGDSVTFDYTNSGYWAGAGRHNYSTSGTTSVSSSTPTWNYKSID